MAASSEDLDQLRLELNQLRQELDEHLRLNAILGEAVEQFVGALVHDIRNPLAAIKISVQGLKRGLERDASLPPDHLAERLLRIEDAVNQALTHLTTARAKINAKTAPRKRPRREPLDLVSLVRDVMKPVQSEAGHHRMQLDTNCPVLVGSWDGTLLRQALTALVDNALKFSAPDGRATVTVRRASDTAEVAVADSGIGIPERDIPHVCERFYRAENVLGRYKGAGLGLFEAQIAIAAHHGQLSIESQEQAGSTFTVRLPLQAG
jgi:signal transduction histidine kinase